MVVSDTMAQGARVAQVEVVADVGQQDGEAGAVELVDGVQPEEHEQREGRRAERHGRRPPLVHPPPDRPSHGEGSYYAPVTNADRC